MEQVTTYIGYDKRLLEFRIKLRVFIYFTLLLFRGELRLSRYPSVLKRLLFFLSKMKENKYVRAYGRTKVNLYVPAYPKQAFFQACKKVMEFEQKMPAITVLMSVTSACRYNCSHCYQKMDKGKDADIDLVVSAARYLQDQGVAFFNIEGGEPFLVFPRLKKLCDAIDRRSEILINSTGDGITYERLMELKANGNLLGIMFSLHTWEPEQLNAFMKNGDAWKNLEQAVKLCHRAGIQVTFNSCLAREDYFNGNFERVMETARDFGGTIIQLIKPKPAGAWLESGAAYFSDEDLRIIRSKVNDYNTLPGFRHYPFIAAMIIDEDADHFGCTAGGTDRFYINAKGDVQPCEFLNISFGNIAKDDFGEIYRKMREAFEVPGTNWLCEKYAHAIAARWQKAGRPPLPLSPEESKEIYQDMEKGSVPDFYNQVTRF